MEQFIPENNHKNSWVVFLVLILVVLGVVGLYYKYFWGVPVPAKVLTSTNSGDTKSLPTPPGVMLNIFKGQSNLNIPDVTSTSKVSSVLPKEANSLIISEAMNTEISSAIFSDNTKGFVINMSLAKTLLQSYQLFLGLSKQIGTIKISSRADLAAMTDLQTDKYKIRIESVSVDDTHTNIKITMDSLK